MFGIGGTELLVLAAVALVVVGPKRLPEVMRLFGKGLGEFRRMAHDVRSTVTAEMDRIDLEEKTKKAHEELFGDKKPEDPAAAARAPEEKASPADGQAPQAQAQAQGTSAQAPEAEHVMDEWSVEQAEKKAATAATEGHALAGVQTPDEVKAELDAAREACRKAEAESADPAAKAPHAEKTAEKAAPAGSQPGKPA